VRLMKPFGERNAARCTLAGPGSRARIGRLASLSPCLLVSLSPCLLVCFVGCTVRTPARTAADDERKLPRLETALPQRTAVEVTSELTATLEAFEKADLCAQVRGIVTKIAADIDIGHVIKQGEALLAIEIPDLCADLDHKVALKEQADKLRTQAEHNRSVAAAELSEAQAQEQRYQADLKYRDLQHRRLVELSKRETVQPQLGEEALMQRDAAQSALTAALAQIQTKKARLLAADGEVDVAQSRIKAAQAAVSQAATMVDFGTIRAPFDGIVTKRWIDRGVTIKDPGMPLLTVMRIDRVRVVLDVPEREVPAVRSQTDASGEATAVRLRIPALPDAVFNGKVTLLAGAIDPATRTMRVEVHLDNPDRQLRPQMTGTARLLLARHENALTVPSSALARSGDQAEVYYIDAPHGTPPRGAVKRAVVETGLDDGLRVEIRKGLTGNERIITKGNSLVRIGETAIAAERGPAELR
jgi:HlyD family secretion protein